MSILPKSPSRRHVNFPKGHPPDPETFVDHVVGIDSMGGEVFASDVDDEPAIGDPMSLAETLDREALAYRGWNTPIGDFLADQMDRVAYLVRFTGATTPREYADRLEVLDLGIAEQHFDRGYTEGAAATRR